MLMFCNRKLSKDKDNKPPQDPKKKSVDKGSRRKSKKSEDKGKGKPAAGTKKPPPPSGTKKPSPPAGDKKPPPPGHKKPPPSGDKKPLPPPGQKKPPTGDKKPLPPGGKKPPPASSKKHPTKRKGHAIYSELQMNSSDEDIAHEYGGKDYTLSTDLGWDPSTYYPDPPEATNETQLSKLIDLRGELSSPVMMLQSDDRKPYTFIHWLIAMQWNP